MARGGTNIVLYGPLALAAVLFLLSYQAGASNQPDPSDTYIRLGEVMIVLWFIIVIINMASRRRR